MTKIKLLWGLTVSRNDTECHTMEGSKRTTKRIGQPVVIVISSETYTVLKFLNSKKFPFLWP